MKNFILGSASTLILLLMLAIGHSIYETNKTPPVVAEKPIVIQKAPVKTVPVVQTVEVETVAPVAVPEPLAPAVQECSNEPVVVEKPVFVETQNTIGFFGLIPTASYTTTVNNYQTTTTNNTTNTTTSAGNNGNGNGNTGPGNQGNDSDHGNAGGNSGTTSTTTSSSSTSHSQTVSTQKLQSSLGLMYQRRQGRFTFLGGVTLESSPTFLLGAGYNF